MMEMHSFFPAKQVELTTVDSGRRPLAQNLLGFAYQLSGWLQAIPSVYRGEQAMDDSVYVWFNDTAFAEDEFWQVFGDCFAMLSSRWGLDIFGTSAQSQETVWLSVRQEGVQFTGMQRTLSGEPADTIQSLCLRIGCESPRSAEELQTLFQETNWENETVALAWKSGAFLSREAIAVPVQNSCFCYGSVLGSVSEEDALQALGFQKKTVLWTDFLKDGFDYAEYEWLYHSIENNSVPNRIEWELALHTAMQNSGCTIRMSPNDFELFDGKGNRRYYSINSTNYGERAFLKLLFPLNL